MTDRWEDLERRRTQDRRKARLPILESLLGYRRRRTVRRQSDRQSFILLDHYGRSVILPAFIVLGLSLADALLTLFLMGHGAMELNPVMDFFLGLGAPAFLIAKYSITAFSVIIVVLLNYVFIRRLKLYVKDLLVLFAGGFAVVICWEIFLVMRYVV